MKKTRTVEYYRLWPIASGDNGTWDTDTIQIPADTPHETAEIEKAIRKVLSRAEWANNQHPVQVGLYADTNDTKDEDSGPFDSEYMDALDCDDDWDDCWGHIGEYEEDGDG